MRLDKTKVELLRAKKLKSVNELVEEAGICKPTLNRGYRKDIDPVSVGKIAKALEVEPEEIIKR